MRVTGTSAAALVPCVVAGLAIPIGACLGPTEIVLDVRTDVTCSDSTSWRGVAVSVGQPGADVESRSPVLTTTTCAVGGEIGTLAVVPTGAKDAQVGIRVVAGITRNPEDCAAKGYDGCIVARRTVAYLPHESQRLIVDLTSACIGNACDLNHTCVNGSCTDTVTAKPPVAADGGPLTGPTVRCGDDGTRCPRNDPSNACCVAFDFDAGTGKGSCMPAASCPSSSAVLYCDDPSDCEPGDAADPDICCVSNAIAPVNPNLAVTNSTCQPASTCSGANYFGQVRTFCDERQVCPRSGNNCLPAGGAPGYFACTTQ
jgi:hypothetical protein